jgi:Spy/CpxP family protein refolding chaperone
MRTSVLLVTVAMLWSLAVQAQSAPPKPMPPEAGTFGISTGGGPGMGPKTVMIRREMGRWWKNSDIAKKLQLNENQVTQLDQIYYDHRMKLIDYGAEMEKEDLKMQTLLDADVPNEGQINSQVDQVLGARGKLEREYTMMNLDLRKVLSVEQWRQLKSIRGEHGMGGNMMYFQKRIIGPPGSPKGELPPLPPPPPPGGEGDEPL